MQKLGQQDAMFLYTETERAPMHLCSFHLYAPANDGETLTFEQFREHVRSRLPLARVLRRKLARVPFDLDYPYWVEDGEFELDYHVRHVTLPAPRDWRALWDLAASLHSVPLDLHRPPWELYLIDGIDNVDGYAPGSIAMLIKIHHCAIDGIAGIELMNALHDLDPGGRDPVVDTWKPEPTPAPLALLAMTAANAAQAPLRAARFLTHSVPALRPFTTMRVAWDATAGAKRPTPTRLNQRVTANRVGDAIVIDLGDAKRVRAAVAGATVNDVLLAVVGGGLRRYLGETGDLPPEPMMAGVPISMRTDADVGTAGNKIAMMLVSLGTDVDDPRQRLAMVQRSTSQSKEQQQAVEARVMAEGAELLPGALLGLAVRANSAQPAAGVTAQIGNVCVTNVPGSQVPLYLRGFQMLAYFSLGPVYDNAGPIHLIVSYLGKIYLSVTTCREIVPDIGRYVACLQRSWDELVATTIGTSAPPTARSSAPRKRAAKGSSKQAAAARKPRERAQTSTKTPR
jgi:diacylglycerol O-acyltransferase